jgi:NIMA (never in mitosis gene a)-related kinase
MECDVPINHDPDNQYGVLSNFEIDKKIGKGQFSEVYRARCKVDGSIVALKKVQVNLDIG